MANSAFLGCRGAARLIARRTLRETNPIDAPCLPSEGHAPLPSQRPRPAAVLRTPGVPDVLPEAYWPVHRDSASYVRCLVARQAPASVPFQPTPAMPRSRDSCSDSICSRPCSFIFL